VVGSSAQFHAAAAVEPIVAAAAASKKPLAAFLAPHADESLALLAAAGVAAFRTPESCADAVRAFLDWTRPKPTPAAPQGLLDKVSRALAASAAPVLDEMAAGQVFEALGIPSAPARLLEDNEASSPIGYPVAAKVVSAGIAHKTEAGGVVLGIADDAALAQAVGAIRARVAETCADAHVSGVLVQRMETGLAEVLIGYRRTPEVGPVVTVALGGTLAEIYGDSAVRVAPVDLETARDMIAEVKGLAPIRGYRGLPKGDCEALAAAIQALSNLADLPPTGPHVLEAEINPLIVKGEGEGVSAIDGLVVLSGDEM